MKIDDLAIYDLVKFKNKETGKKEIGRIDRINGDEKEVRICTVIWVEPKDITMVLDKAGQ